MSDGQNQNPTGDNTDKEEIKDPKAVLEKNKELLGKNKTLSTQLKELQDRFSKIEEEKLKGEGKKDEILESYKKKVSDLEGEKNKIGWNFITGQVAVEATKRGCVNTATLMKVIDLQNASINMDDFTVAKEDIESILEKASKEHEYLFKKQSNPPKDGGVGNSTPPLDIDKASMDDLKNLYRKLKT
jgi:hypothetical protein